MSRKRVAKNISYDDVKKLYYVNMDYGKNEAGKRIKAAKTFEDLKDAKRALKEFEADKTKKTLVMPDHSTLEAWLSYWLNNIKSLKCEQTTLHGYRNIINNHIVPAIGKIKIQDIKVETVNRYLKLAIDKGLSKQTVKKHRDLLNDALAVAVKEDKILKNPVERSEEIKAPKADVAVYNVEQMKQLFKAVEGDRMEVVVKLAALLGLRREEILGLKWKNVDFASNTIYVNEARTQAGKHTIEKATKTKSSTRKLHMPEALNSLLSRIVEQQKQTLGKEEVNPEGFVMAWEDGKPYRPNYVSDLFHDIIAKHGLPPIRLHDLRHSFASLSNFAGDNLYNISKALGHSNIGITAGTYTHSFDDTNKGTIEKVASLFADH